jgi:hypothetical protein
MIKINARKEVEEELSRAPMTIEAQQRKVIQLTAQPLRSEVGVILIRRMEIILITTEMKKK